jgi:hypothetical protein
MLETDGAAATVTAMPFCTLVEWDRDFDLGRLGAMVERSGGHDTLPEGCLLRVVGAVESGARVIEIWRSADDAKRFAEAQAPLLSELPMPPPDRVAGFQTTVYQTPAGPG